MAHNDFENNIQSRFQSFESTPPESVWTNIKNFRDRRKKRLFFFWWLLPSMLIASSSALYFNLTNDSINTSVSAIHNTDKLRLKKNNKANNETSNDQAVTITDTSTRKTSNVPKPTFEAPDKPARIQPKKAPTDVPTSEEIVLNKMQSLQVKPQEKDLKYAPVQPITPQFQPMWRRSIGIELGSFVSVSRIEYDTPPSTTSYDPVTSSQKKNYFRFLEVSPYIEWQNRTTGMGFRTNLMYSAANFSTPYLSTGSIAKQQSFGLGLEANYEFIRKRFGVRTYLKFQGETISTRYSNGAPYDWSNPGGNGGALPNENNGTTSSSVSRRWVLSGEAGIRCSYVLPNPYWRLNGSLGYRNYFWQQPISDDISTLRIPQLIQISLGVSIDL